MQTHTKKHKKRKRKGRKGKKGKKEKEEKTSCDPHLNFFEKKKKNIPRRLTTWIFSGEEVLFSLASYST
jgi:hypothetical protein